MMLEGLLITTCLYQPSACQKVGDVYMKNNPEIGTYVSNQGDKIKDFFETGFGKQPTEVTASIAYAVFKHTARFKAARDLYIDLGSKTMLGEPNSYYFFKLIYSF